jgi:hypothetical protein
MITTPLAALAALVSLSDANAAGFQVKTMRDTLSTREVERGLVNGKGWLEFGLGYDYKVATEYWDTEGEPQEFDNATWLYTTQRLDIRYGVARRGEFYWTIKTHYVRLQNDLYGTDTDQFGFGDPNFGYKWEAFRSLAPLTSFILYADYKAPFGNESPGNYVSQPNSFQSFVLTTGTPDLSIGVRFKRQLGPAAFTLGAAYIHRFGGVATYLVETNENQFNARIKPGDIQTVDGDLMLQLGPAAVHGTVVYEQHGEVRTGTSAGGMFPNRRLDPWPGTDGWSVDVIPGVIINATRGFDIDLAARIPLRGEDSLVFFPIEDLTPTLGNTYSATLRFRY